MKNHYYFLLCLILTGMSVPFLAVSDVGKTIPNVNVELKNATYFGLYENSITLKNGRWEGEPFAIDGESRPMVELLDDFHLIGDLDEDGIAEHVVILWQNSGGSAVQYYLAVMRLQAGKLINLSTVFIGDRVQLQAGYIFNDQIKIDIIQAGAGEPACCPTQKATQTWRLDGDILKPENVELKGFAVDF